MDAYTGFAEVYDTFMDDIPYGEWCSYIKGLLWESGVRDGIVLELGCGTGSLTELLAAEGYDMIGIDNSPDMLRLAYEKRLRSGHDILYLCQDMREFELYGTVAAVVSVCGSLNYITGPGDLGKVFRLVNNYLDPGGLFVFDMDTEYKYSRILGDNVIAEDRDACSFIWDNCYDSASGINVSELSLFALEDVKGNLYRKYHETHIQRAYGLEEVKAALAKASLDYLGAYEAFTHDPVKKESERMCVLARERGKRRGV